MTYTLVLLLFWAGQPAPTALILPGFPTQQACWEANDELQAPFERDAQYQSSSREARCLLVDQRSINVR